ncbi:MAG: HAD-IA family hydrolase [Pseudomonadota bacterium]
MKLVIFDCDGTLVDSQHGIVDSMSRALANEGFSPLPRDRILSVVGLSLSLAVQRLLPEAEPVVVERVVDGYRQAFTELRQNKNISEPLYEGIKGLVSKLRGQDDVLLGVATGKSIRGVKRLFDQQDWHATFVTMQTADTNASKPHPEMIEKAMAEAGVDAVDTVMIGDTTFDIEMAQNANVRGIGVAWGYHPVDHLRNAGAHSIVDDSHGLSEAIDSFLGQRR